MLTRLIISLRRFDSDLRYKMTMIKTTYSEKLKRNVIVCDSCGKGIEGNAYSSLEGKKGYECEKCSFKVEK